MWSGQQAALVAVGQVLALGQSCAVLIYHVCCEQRPVGRGGAAFEGRCVWFTTELELSSRCEESPLRLVKGVRVGLGEASVVMETGPALGAATTDLDILQGQTRPR
ncbi:hypothetical protein TREES_T100008755 [Tupaia chinensis]|uniref:Secreted protein n=1 Tax=Tupaia chinensis TaxID=246437 RepID=L9L066_TUPCH|nr:hypothetical protein TREES_T100008755 [Tupaia chinensis]